MTAQTIIGIDPGLSGAVAFLRDGAPTFEPMPIVSSHTKKKLVRVFDLLELHALVGRCAGGRIVLEGFANFGLPSIAVHALVRCITAVELSAMLQGVPVTVVPSQTWQKVMFEHVEPKDLKPKAKAKIACERLWGAPTAKWSEGQRDAALIAEYGRRTLQSTP